MAAKLYFETLTEGMHAKFNSRYTPRRPVSPCSNGPSMLAQRRNVIKGFFADAIKLTHNRLH